MTAGSVLIIECRDVDYLEMQDSIAALVKEMWVARGAKPSKEPVGKDAEGTLYQTGKIGVGVGFAGTDTQSTHEVLALCDSEGYVLDLQLAEEISRRYSVTVHAAQLETRRETGWARSYKKGKASKPATKYKSVARKLSKWPGVRYGSHNLTTFKDMREDTSNALQFFEHVPYAKGQLYCGPPPDAPEGFSLEKTSWIASERFEKIKDEACMAGASGDWSTFDELFASVPAGQRSLLHNAAWELRRQGGDPLLVFRLQEMSTQRSGTLDELNNTAAYFLPVADFHGLPEHRLERLIHLWNMGARLQSDIWHNLACVYAKLGDNKGAKDCIFQAVTRGATAAAITAMREDGDLALILDDADIQAALA